MKKILPIVMTIILLFTVFCGCGINSTVATERSGIESEISTEQASGERGQESNLTGPKEIKINLMACEYIYNTDVLEQAAYYNDNIFAAVVVAVGENFDPFWEPEYVEQYGAVSVYDPCYTKYKLQVTQVIKGELQTGDVIDSKKLGYFNEEEQAYYMVESDVMPIVGEEYLFLANNRMDSNVYHLNSVVPMESNASEISTYAMTDEAPNRQAIIAQYIAAYENETPYVEPDADDNANPFTELVSALE